jgi:hypothetical protein
MNLFYSGNKELRSGWKILRVFVFVIILVVVFALLASLLNIEALGEYAFHLAIITSLLVELWLERKPISFIGLRFPDKRFWIDLLLGIVWGSLSIGLIVAGMVFITREMSLAQIGHAATSVGLGNLFFYWLIVAIAEEGLFRGHILSILRHRVSPWAGLTISASIFAAMHLINPDYYWFAFIYAFLIGIALGGIVIKRGDLGCVIGFHYAWNLLQEKGLLNTPDRGGEVIYMVVLLAILALVYWVLPSRVTNEV